MRIPPDSAGATSAPQPASGERDGDLVLPPLRVRTLGVFAVWRGEEPAPPALFAQHKAALIFKALLSAPGQRLNRDQLLDLLWPETNPEQAAQRLRSTLHRLRGALGAAYLPGSGDLVLLDPAPGTPVPPAAWLDAMAFERAAAAALATEDLGVARAALGLYTGAYLPEEPDEGEVGARRRALRGLARALTMHTARLAPAGEATHLLGELLREDPAHEEAALALMHVLEGQGRTAEALRVYDALALALGEELGLDPGPALQAVRARFLAPAPPSLVPHAPGSASTPPDMAIRTAAPLGNLPAPVASLIGRVAELATLRELLRSTRLLSLIGSGGVGKTRLALALAHAVQVDYAAGAWVVDLARVMDPSLVAPTVAAMLKVREEPGQELMVSLTQALRRYPPLLLLIDNVEHLVDPVATLVVTLLQAVPTLRVLVTSREALALSGEARFRVPSLALPYTDDLGAVAESDAAALVLARARAVQPRFDLDAVSAPVLAALCRRLDGIPLALELAAARLAVLSLPELVARLDDRFRLLSGGSRTALPRHQTLRATLDWSYVLLTGAEQAVLRRLSVFASGCTLDAAEAVCVGEDVVNAEILDLFTGLVDKSLVEVGVEGSGAVRYRLLETVRAYAATHLVAAHEREQTRRRLGDWALMLIEQAAPELRGAGQEMWLTRLETEHDNLRAALGWARDSGETESGLRMAGALWRFWGIRGYFSEGRAWIEGLLAQEGAARVPSDVRARALNGTGVLAWSQGNYAQAEESHEESLALRRAAGDAAGAADSLGNLGVVAYERGDHARARTLYEEALALAREGGDTWSIGRCLGNLANLAVSRGDVEQARALLEESLALWQSLGDLGSIALTLTNLGDVAHERGDDLRARALLEEGLTLAREVGDTRVVALSLMNLGQVRHALGHAAEGQALLEEGVTLYARQGGTREAAAGLEVLADVVAARGQPTKAVRLLGAVARLRASLRAARSPRDEATVERISAVLREALGAEEFVAAWEAGQTVALANVIDTILHDPKGTP